MSRARRLPSFCGRRRGTHNNPESKTTTSATTCIRLSESSRQRVRAPYTRHHVDITPSRPRTISREPRLSTGRTSRKPRPEASTRFRAKRRLRARSQKSMPPSRGKALVESLPKPPPSQRAARSSDPFEGAFFAPGAAGQQARQLVRKVRTLLHAATVAPTRAHPPLGATLPHRATVSSSARPCVARRSIATRASR